MDNYKISIIMLTHNAPAYIRIAIESLKEKTQGIDYEMIVVDNRSGFRTRILLKQLYRKKLIDKIQWNKKNLLFAAGNNIGSRLAAEDATHYLLINSDVKIKEGNWLRHLAEICPKGGICAYGLVEDEPIRADGYCMLVDSRFYRDHELDEEYEWFWSITKLQAQALQEGRGVIAVKEHDEVLVHFGGKSGNSFQGARGMDEKRSVICSWFRGKEIEIRENIEAGHGE